MVALPALAAYRRFVVAFSGDKGSLAALLVLLQHGVPAERIELHHHEGDGQGALIMDWSTRRARPMRGEVAFGGVRMRAHLEVHR